jgi:asparaginyl-tRNA synthetase
MMMKTVMVDDIIKRLRSEKTQSITKVQSEIRICAGQFLRKKGFVEINPVIISPLTDPLRHETLNGSIKYLEHTFQLTRSMIFHKQISLIGLNKIFVFSPNVRLEQPRYAETNKHLIEFTQIDVEIKNATREETMDLVEDMLIEIFCHIKDYCHKELAYFNRTLVTPRKPFKRIKYLEAYKEYGEGFDMYLSKSAKEPFWIIDFPIEAREFYDRQYEEQPGVLCDMDMVYPEGYGEALSGGEREYEYAKIIERIAQTELHPKDYQWYLEFAKRGLPSCCGFGIGVERLTRFICGLSNIADATIFPKVPGSWTI